MKNMKRVLSGLLALIMVLAVLPASVFATEAADVVINIAEVTNGSVTADKESYQIGDTVTLTVAPDAGYAQKLYVNGEPVLLDYATGNYSFVATEEAYDITGGFVAAEKWFWTADWNLINQGHGVVYTPAHPEHPNRSGDLAPEANKNNYLGVLVKDPSHGDQKEYAVVLKAHFTGGKKAEVRLLDRDDNGKYCLQAMGDSFSSWNTLYWLTAEENAAVKDGDGVWYAMSREGTALRLLINGSVVYEIDLTVQGLTAETVLEQMKLQTYNFGYAVAIPYILEAPGSAKPVALSIAEMTDGTVTADKESYQVGDTVTLTVAADKGYAQKLYINGEPMLLDYATGKYSFVATEEAYEITGGFVAAEKWFWTADWNLINQGYGVAYAPAHTDGSTTRSGDLVPEKGVYNHVLVQFKDVSGGAQKELAIVLKMAFDGGKKAEVRLIDRDDNGKYCLQAMGDSFSNWSTLYWLTAEENLAVVSGNGVWYDMVRDGTMLSLLINDKVVKQIDMSAQGITAETVLDQIKIQTYNFGYAMEVPYAFINSESAAEVAVNIAALTNGTVTADKQSYKVGDVVTLTVAPNAGYSQKLYINGEPLMLPWKSNTYSFLATEEVYNITGSFEANSWVASDAGRWDTANQAYGVINAYYPGNNDSWWIDAKGDYQSITVKAKNYLSVADSKDGDGKVGFAMILRVTMDNGKAYAFRIYNDKGTYAFSYFGGSNSATGWGSWKNIHDAYAAALNGDGVDFKMERTGANQLKFFLNGNEISTYTIPDVTADNKVVSMSVQSNGNKGQYVAIPYVLKEAAKNSVLNIAELTNGTVTADKQSYKVGDTVTLTVAPNAGYSQKLYINDEPLMMLWKSNTYSFVATEEVYNITGSFEPNTWVASDAGRWDSANQAHGVVNTYYPANTDSWWIDAKGEYQSITVNAKNPLPVADSMDGVNGSVGFGVVLRVHMDNGKNYAFRIYNDKGTYAHSWFGGGGSANGWGSWKNIHAAYAETLNGDGVLYKLERTAADKLTLTINGNVIETYTMEGVTDANKVVSMGVQSNGLKGKSVTIPYELQKAHAHEIGANSHNCVICGIKLSDCVDAAPKDHKCDICGAAMGGECVDTNADHNCDYCGAMISNHTGDSICTICGKVFAQAGETVTLAENLTIAELVIPAEVTLDLNGHILTADSLASFGDIIDTAGNGCLVAGELELTENSYLPVFDSAANGYRFFAYEMKNLGVKAAADQALFGFAFKFEDAAVYELLANGADTGVSVTMTLAWGENAQPVAFSAELVRQYAALQIQRPALQAAMILTVTGLDALASGDVLTVTPAVYAAGDQQVGTSAAMTYTR